MKCRSDDYLKVYLPAKEAIYVFLPQLALALTTVG